MNIQACNYVFKRDDLLGEGAFAKVYLGRHKEDSKKCVAVKEINLDKIPNCVDALKKEINILKKFKHRNIVQLYNFEKTDKFMYLILEFCNGRDLGVYLKVKQKLREDTVKIFLRQMVSAVKAMYANGIVHRDLKPQNILLCCPYGDLKSCPPDQMILKIGDFGFARVLEGEAMTLTQCGSPIYMAPEVILSERYNAKADLWSIGTILYQCLFGKVPFQAASQPKLRNVYEKNRNLRPSFPPNTISLQMQDLLLKLLKRSNFRISFQDFFHHPVITSSTSHNTTSSPVTTPGHSHEFDSTSSPLSTNPFKLPKVDAKQIQSKEVDGFVLIEKDDCSPPTPISSPYKPSKVQLASGVSPHRVNLPHLDCQRRLHQKEDPNTFQTSSKQTHEVSVTKDYELLFKPEHYSNPHLHPITPSIPEESKTKRPSYQKLKNSNKHSVDNWTTTINLNTLSVQRTNQKSTNIHQTETDYHTLLNKAQTVPDFIRFGQITEEMASSPEKFYKKSNFPIQKCRSSGRLSNMVVRMMLNDRQQKLFPGYRLKECWSQQDLVDALNAGSSSSIHSETTEPPNFTIGPKDAIPTSSKQRSSRVDSNFCKQLSTINMEDLKEEDELEMSSNDSKSSFTAVDEADIELDDLQQITSTLSLVKLIMEVAENHISDNPGQLKPSDNGPFLYKRIKEKLLLLMRALRIVDSTLHTVRNKFSANLLRLNGEIKLVITELNCLYKTLLALCFETTERIENLPPVSHQLMYDTVDSILLGYALKENKTAALEEAGDIYPQKALARYEKSQILLTTLIDIPESNLNITSLKNYKCQLVERINSTKGFV